MTRDRESARGELVLAQAFAPMHKRAFGLAVGLTVAAGVFLLTAFHVIARPEGPRIEFLAVYFHGFDVTWRGACIGAWWAFVAGFVAGWFAAFVRNLILAIRLTILRVRLDLHQTRSFLDEI